MRIKTLLFTVLMAAAAMTASAQLTKENLSRYYNEFKTIFTDGTCSELVEPYASMSDEQFLEYWGDFPKELIDIAMKVKNNSWAAREKEFRVAEYEPYGNTYSWSVLLNTYQYSYLQNPTGITATTGDSLLIFVNDNLPSGMMLKLIEIVKNEPFSDYNVYDSEKYLTKGANLVTVTQPEAILFIGYAVNTDTTANSKRISDYGNVKIHIEGGKVNGFFDIDRHTDEDWRDMVANHFKHYSVQVKGKRVLFHMERENITAVCPNTISDAIGWWDQCLEWQHELMGVNKYYDRWNSLLMARDGYEDMYMYATSNYTYYEHSTLADILPWKTVYESPGKMWGPAHEIGHINQGTINIVSCTEASNNLFSNVQVHRVGKSTTRGAGVADCRNDFSNSTAFPLRGNVIGKSRMFFQLYLYFHAAGKDTTFYPRLFEALRQDRLRKVNGGNTYAKDDQLKFAEKCCEIAQMDLSGFFDAWGFFEPMDKAYVGDYGTYYVTLTKEEAEASRARMQKYEKKGGHLIFIEDRIKPSKRTDGVDGYRIDFSDEFKVGEMGKTGQWEDYINENVKAEGYYYTRNANNIVIKLQDNAKGALGFKLYNAETGELLDFNNEYSLKIPAAYSMCTIKVVAAQADGIDTEIPNAADCDDESIQAEALSAVVSTAKALIGKKTTTGKEIGYFYADAIKDITDLCNEAKAAADNLDTSKHSYKEWIEILQKAMEELKNNPNSRAYLKELDVYTLANGKARSYYLCYNKLGLIANTSTQTANTMPDKRWMVECTGESHNYYIKNMNGLYINDIEVGLGVSCSGQDKSNALAFIAEYLDNGTLTFKTKENGVYLTLDTNEYKLVGSTTLLDAATWGVRCVEQNNTAVEEIETESGKAGEIYDLQGRKVENPGKGVYIIDGKKVLVK